MPLDLIDFFIGGVLAVGGAIVGYLLGVVLDINTIAAAAFAPASNTGVQNAAAQAGIFPLMFSFAFAAIGFLIGVVWSARQP